MAVRHTVVADFLMTEERENERGRVLCNKAFLYWSNVLCINVRFRMKKRNTYIFPPILSTCNIHKYTYNIHTDRGSCN